MSCSPMRAVGRFGRLRYQGDAFATRGPATGFVQLRQLLTFKLNLSCHHLRRWAQQTQQSQGGQ